MPAAKEKQPDQKRIVASLAGGEPVSLTENVPGLDRELTEGTWMSHADANQSVMMMVPNVGTFVRVLIPVHLTGGYTVTFGAWLGVHPDDLQRAFSVWTSPSYVDLRLEGRLANALPAWDVFAVPAEAAVKDPDHTPYLVGSSDSVLSEVLTQEWPRETILSGLP